MFIIFILIDSYVYLNQMDSKILELLEKTNVLDRRMLVAINRQLVAIERRNALLNDQYNLVLRTPSAQYRGDQISELLRTMNISDDNLLRECYDFLCSHPLHTRRLMEIPVENRWNRLQTYMSREA